MKTAEQARPPEQAVPQTVKPGVYPESPEFMRKRGAAVSVSGLNRLIDNSPFHYWDYYVNADRPPSEPPTPSLIMGDALDTYLFEPLAFDERFVVVPEEIQSLNKNSKEGKARWTEFKEQAGKRKTLTPEQHADVQHMCENLMAHPVMKSVLADGDPQRVAYWIDPDTGILCTAKFDWLRTALVMDLKSTVDASPEQFAKSVYNYNYHRQGAMYLDAVAAAIGERHTNFLIMCVENKRPFACAAYSLDDQALAKGREEYKRGLERLARCYQTNEWPDYGPTVQSISLPPWALRRAS